MAIKENELKRILGRLRRWLGWQTKEGAINKPVPPYARLFFDHLYSEYVMLKPSINDASVISLLEEICQKRQQRDLTWANIYTFDLTLIDWRPAESLIRKAYDARGRYRSVAGQKEYDEYLASKPPDLSEIQLNTNAPPPNPIELLRADIKYLISKFYLYYAMLPVRETLRDELTRNAVLVTGAVVMAIAVAILINVGIAANSSNREYSVVFITVLTVILAGIVGGCVSMLQRIQSAPSEGDALFNLAALNNGWNGIILSPLYGGIFASLLFVLFAAGILNGSIFPVINTPKSEFSSLPSPNASPTLAPSSPEGRPVAVANELVKEPIQIKEFLKKTGPVDGTSYALLIIWSFLAGFAERLVPDTLNRLVAKNQAIQGNNG